MPNQAVTPGQIEIDIADAIVNDLREQEIQDVEALIISGDLITHARWTDHGEHAYQVLRKLCASAHLPHNKVFIVPGNHDYEWYVEDQGRMTRKALKPEQAADPVLNFGHVVHFNNFLDQFRGANRYRLPSVHTLQLPEYALKIGLLDSCKITATRFHEYGYLSSGQIKSLQREFDRDVQPREVRAIVLHHHVTSVIPAEPPSEEASVSVTLDAARLLDYSLNIGVSLFLHGHQHYPCVSRMNKSHTRAGAVTGFAQYDMYVLSAGSASVKRERLMPEVPNTYSIITFDADRAHVKIRRIYSNGTDGSTYLESDFPLFIHHR